MKRRTYLSTAVAGTAALSGCLSMLPFFGSDWPDRPLPETPTGSWTQYGADGANSFTPNAKEPQRWNLAWTSESFTRWQPVIADGMVYTTNFDPSTDGSVIALDAQDGTEQWRTTLDTDDRHGTVVVDGRVIVAYGRDLVALDAQTGDRLWTQSTKGFRVPDQLGADAETGTVLLASRFGIQAFGATDGTKRWETETVNLLDGAPAVFDGRVFAVGTMDGAPSLVALSLDDGSVHWQRELAATPESAAPVATAAGVFVADDGTLVVHDRETGDRLRELYTFSSDGGTYDIGSIAVDDGSVFLTSDGGAVALDSETGTERWHYDESLYETDMCVGSETVVFQVKNPEFAPDQITISAFDRESGEMRWYHGFDPGFHNQVTSPPVLVDGAVYFTANTFDGVGAIGDVPASDS
ncbi:WD-40 repeat-containing protein [Halovivax asiaticus JCM 14624]|uniref:WD-40 repeat-containing protein n=1 Tax=Halovivax asiaticus JCM 14624 TaxID=1227490 RepID=M0BDY6_9EURY|nr:PQQ-binding-like beta-propeller repeat protein [Halovivax asiaticus]ELZ09101.1 WD-40 repeat-containing protein [Halovivax asiaticus JCM 14624]